VLKNGQSINQISIDKATLLLHVLPDSFRGSKVTYRSKYKVSFNARVKFCYLEHVESQPLLSPSSFGS